MGFNPGWRFPSDPCRVSDTGKLSGGGERMPRQTNRCGVTTRHGMFCVHSVPWVETPRIHSFTAMRWGLPCPPWKNSAASSKPTASVSKASCLHPPPANAPNANPTTEFYKRKTVASVFRKKPHLIRNAGMETTLYLHSTRANANRIQQSLADYEAGNIQPGELRD